MWGTSINHLKCSSYASYDSLNVCSATCWNCGGAHVLSACQEKRDPKRINEARREFAAQQMEKKQATEKFVANICHS